MFFGKLMNNLELKIWNHVCKKLSVGDLRQLAAVSKQLYSIVAPFAYKFLYIDEKDESFLQKSNCLFLEHTKMLYVVIDSRTSLFDQIYHSIIEKQRKCAVESLCIAKYTPNYKDNNYDFCQISKIFPLLKKLVIWDPFFNMQSMSLHLNLDHLALTVNYINFFTFASISKLPLRSLVLNCRSQTTYHPCVNMDIIKEIKFRGLELKNDQLECFENCPNILRIKLFECCIPDRAVA